MPGFCPTFPDDLMSGYLQDSLKVFHATPPAIFDVHVTNDSACVFARTTVIPDFMPVVTLIMSYILRGKQICFARRSMTAKYLVSVVMVCFIVSQPSWNYYLLDK